MRLTGQDHSVIEIDGLGEVFCISFTKDGKELLGGGDKGMIRRWRVGDDSGHEATGAVRAEAEATIKAAALSLDGRWLVGGLNIQPYARVWDTAHHTRNDIASEVPTRSILDIHDHKSPVLSVDISWDSTKFATGGQDDCAFIFSIATGELLVGPLRHRDCVFAVRFSTISNRIATASSSVRVYDIDNGQQLLEIQCPLKSYFSSPLAWSVDGCQLFAIVHGESMCFDASSGSLLRTWSIPGHDEPFSPSCIAVSCNHNVIAVVANKSLSFWDTLTHEQIGPVIEHPSRVYSMDLSPNDYIVTGEENGTVTLRNLRDVLPDSYFLADSTQMAIDTAMRDVVKKCPIFLIDVRSGRLCDEHERMDVFKSEPRFKELISSQAPELHDEQMPWKAVTQYFQYVMFSHVWKGKEPSYKDVKSAGSVWNLELSPLNIKLRKFCEEVRKNGYLWAWSDTCCIDKTNSTEVNKSLKMMYKWYEESAATFILLHDSPRVRLKDSEWMTRAWTSQELLAPKVIRFYDCNWKPYLGDTRTNHKESSCIMQELAKTIGVTREIITTFHPDSLSVREKLRLASMRRAKLEEDIAYSLIGIFRSDILPYYGEGYNALGHLLEEIVARSGEVDVLAWAGKSSSYNSCLSATLAVYNQIPHAPPVVEGTELEMGVVALGRLLSHTDAVQFHDRITRLPSARFANRRLHLPSIIFPVRNLTKQASGSGTEVSYRAWASGIGYVEFHTLDRLPVSQESKLIFVHPWIRDLYDPLDGVSWGHPSHNGPESLSEAKPVAGSSPVPSLHAMPANTLDERTTRALRLIVRLQQPFNALLLQRQPGGEFKRVAADHEIPVSGFDPQITSIEDIRTGVVDIL